VIVLVAATDADFEWMLGRSPAPSNLKLPEGGVAENFVIEHVGQIAARQRDAEYVGSWLIVEGGEVVGLCGHHAPPVDGTIEIGYNVAPQRQRRGYATRAIALLVEDARERDDVETVIAQTAPDNVASQRVLEHNGFARAGEGISDGEPVMRWSQNVRRKTA
jgi:RimJ/RimL family protein N-acetyltransferase